MSSECPLTQACLGNKCRDPCPGTCGIGAKCQVVNHNPICSCPSGLTGDPFTRCFSMPGEFQNNSPCNTFDRLYINALCLADPIVPVNPCQPSPCGPNSECVVRGEYPACSCHPTFVGAPPNCRPECTINPECSSALACVNQKCRDPCPGACGSNAKCNVVNHTPVCSCLPGYIGDPFTGCLLQQGKISAWLFCMMFFSSLDLKAMLVPKS